MSQLFLGISVEFSDWILDAMLVFEVQKELFRLLLMLVPFIFTPYFYAIGNAIIDGLLIIFAMVI